MGEKTGISWTDATWNPVTGCTKVSEGCKFCYAEILAKKLQATGSKRYANGFKVTMHEDVLNLPKKWKEPKKVFVNSMSDLFHKDVPFEFVDKVFAVMAETPQHTYQILTKRPERMREYIVDHLHSCILLNVWIGVSVENASHKDRIDVLRELPGPVRFVSFEPLLNGVGPLNLANIDWVIVGGESGEKHRPMQEDWVLSIFEQARESKVPFFFKQWGGIHSGGAHLLRGKEYHEFPKVK